MTVRHVVVWTLNGVSEQERAGQAAEVARRLTALIGVVPGIRSLTAGVDCLPGGSNADVALVMDVDDLGALEAYQQHPAHREAGAYIRSVAASRVAVDFMI